MKLNAHYQMLGNSKQSFPVKNECPIPRSSSYMHNDGISCFYISHRYLKRKSLQNLISIPLERHSTFLRAWEHVKTGCQIVSGQPCGREKSGTRGVAL